MMPPNVTILSEVAAAHGVTLAKLRSREGKNLLYPARVEAAKRLRDERGLSQQQIGKMLGGRCQQTILRMVNDVYRAKHKAFHKARKAAIREARREKGTRCISL
jgi:chromosomal replication initiation ATPase DnaA